MLSVFIQAPLTVLPQQTPPHPFPFLLHPQLRPQALPYAILIVFPPTQPPFQVQISARSSQKKSPQSTSWQENLLRQEQLREEGRRRSGRPRLGGRPRFPSARKTKFQRGAGQAALSAVEKGLPRVVRQISQHLHQPLQPAASSAQSPSVPSSPLGGHGRKRVRLACGGGEPQPSRWEQRSRQRSLHSVTLVQRLLLHGVSVIDRQSLFSVSVVQSQPFPCLPHVR